MAPDVIAVLPLRHRLLTGDALYCQRDLCRQVRRAGGDYLVVVKENQPALHWAIATLFADPPIGEEFATAVTLDQYGDRLHWVRDVTLGEDASQVRSGAAPQVLAALCAIR